MTKRVKFRKTHRGSCAGNAQRGTKVRFGEYGLQCLGRGWVTNRQIEACRISINRYLKRKGKVWIRIFPHKPVTARPPETRMGKGKGPVEHWVAEVRPGTMMIEISGSLVIFAMAKITSELRELSVDELAARRRELKEEALNLRVQKESGQLENPSRLKVIRREVARIETLLTEKRNAEATA